jgi:phage/conjugal plasmid C-4 type zinc finger TraR family protein
MTDEADMAREIEERARANAIRLQSSHLARQGREFCVDCGERISDSRRAALPSARRCAVCQGLHERGV